MFCERSFITNLTAFQKVSNAPYFINNPCKFPVYFMEEKSFFAWAAGFL